MLKGLSARTSVGRFGRFKENAGNRTIALNTCVVNDVTLFTLGRWAKIIGEPAVGPEVRTKVLSNSWCGRTIELSSGGQTQRVDLYTTMPGPVFTPKGRRWGFDWAVGASFVDLESLPDGKKLKAFATIKNPPQVMLCHHSETPALFLTSKRAQSLEIVTHEHWWLTFKEPGAHIMIVPLVDKDDAPRTKELVRLWLDLLENLPVNIDEEFEYKNDAITIVARAKNATGKPVKVCPIPPMASLLGDCELQQMETGTKLLTGYNGPYSVLPGRSEFRRTIQMDWLNTGLKYKRPIKGELSPLPDELVYAGDMSWDEKYPMDALLSMRVWAPLADIIPEKMWVEVKRRVKFPTPQTFKNTLDRYIEPSVKQPWTKDKTLFEEWGEVSYDTDWYTGLSLSGMWRSAQCSDQQIASAGQKLYKGLKKERDEMIGYCRVFTDWAFDGAFTDPRGEGYDYDCSHNGIEGIIAEGRMRQTEGDLAGRDFCYYIAARFAVCFVAAYPLAELHQRHKWVLVSDKEVADGMWGMRSCRERWGSWPLTLHAKSWPPLFPEYCALLKKYGPLKSIKNLARLWEQKVPERYEDWLQFYVGKELADQIRSGKEDASGAQESREQAGVFYHVGPDVMLRLWTLDENPDHVEQLFKPPMPPAEQILCRAGAKLTSLT